MKGYRDFRVASQDTLSKIKRIMDGEEKGFQTGMPLFDEFNNNGFHKGQMYIIGARSRYGKTTLKNNLMKGLVDNNDWSKIHIIDFSLEMKAERHLMRFASMELKIPYNLIAGHKKDHKIDQTQLASIRNYFLTKEKMPLDFMDFSLNYEHIKRLTHGFKDKFPDKQLFIFLDHLLLVEGEGKDTETEKVNKLVRGLQKDLAQLGSINILLSQVNRGAQDKDSRPTLYEPKLENLKQSGAIEECADIIMLLHRPGIERDLYLQTNTGPALFWHDIPESYPVFQFKNGRICEETTGIIWAKNRDKSGESEKMLIKYDDYGNLIEINI